MSERDVQMERLQRIADSERAGSVVLRLEVERLRKALREITEVNAPRIDEGEIMSEIAREALGIEDNDG